MSKDSRTFKVDEPVMRGEDIQDFQGEVKRLFEELDIHCPIKADGIYGTATRSYIAALCNSYGMIASQVMKDGVTPELRTRLRHHDLTAGENARMGTPELISYRRALRKRYDSGEIKGVHRPVTKVLEHSWGYHPGVHDGVDVITQPDAVTFAMCKVRIIDVRTSGWWGLGAHASGGHPVSDGDGIVQMEILENVGPFKKGHHIGYGHNERPFVRVGQILEAGDKIAHAGFANAWHIHLMHNDGKTSRGIGNLDPGPLVDYALAHG